MDEATIQFIALLVAIAGLLGWVIKAVINYFMKTSKEKSGYIETLVNQNQKNVERFIDTINHQRTLDREMQVKHLDAIRELKVEIRNSNEVNTKMLQLLNKNK